MDTNTHTHTHTHVYILPHTYTNTHLYAQTDAPKHSHAYMGTHTVHRLTVTDRCKTVGLVCVYMHVYMCTCSCSCDFWTRHQIEWELVYTCFWMRVCVWMLLLHLGLWLELCVCVCKSHVCTRVCMCVLVCECILSLQWRSKTIRSVGILLWNMHTRIYVCKCIHIYIYIFVYVRMCVVHGTQVISWLTRVPCSHLGYKYVCVCVCDTRHVLYCSYRCSSHTQTDTHTHTHRQDIRARRPPDDANNSLHSLTLASLE